MSQSDADYVKIMLSMSHGTRGVPRKVGPFRVLGKFNSSKTPKKIYTVKEHLDVPADTGKRVSCTCPSWRSSFRRLGRYGCKHTMHVLALIADAAANVEESIIQKTTRRMIEANARHRWGLEHIVAQALEDADVHISDVPFRALVYHLRPLIKAHLDFVRKTESVKVTERTTIDRDDVLRVITLD
jgi:hypothetical protein